MRRALSAVVVCALIGAGAMLGGSAASADDEPDDIIPTLADALADAAEGGATDAAALADAVGLPVDGPGSLQIDAAGDVSATVIFAERPSDADLDAVRALATVDTVFRFSPAAAVTVDPALLDDLADLPGIVSVEPVLAPTGSGSSAGRATGVLPAASGAGPDCRAFPSDAAGPLGVELARAAFGVDGAGVTVGILADSYANTDPAGPATDVASGLLPGPGNPCGYETPVTVLVDSVLGEDEGRAIAQLVHGIAPGARLMFHTAKGGSHAMAEGIVALAEAGADIIVDDVGYLDEPRYQQGVISAAISHVQESGVAYYSAVGNDNVIGRQGASTGKAIGSWETSAFRGMTCPAWVVVPTTLVPWECLDFDPSAGTDPTDTLTFDSPSEPSVMVSWAEPVYGVSSIMVPQMYQNENLVSGVASAGAAPVMLATLDVNHPSVDGDIEVVVLRAVLPGVPATSPAIWTALWAGHDQLAAREYDTSSASGEDLVGLRAMGHGADGTGIGVAAAYWRTPTVPEKFTSPGETTLYFEPVAFGPDATADPSAAYPQPLTVPGPQIAAVDGNRTSFFGESLPGEDGDFFFGTSAAAPNAAAVHALALEYAPAATADGIAQAAFATARAMTNPIASSVTDEQSFGAGLIDANALLTRLPPRAVTGLGATALSESSIAVEWDAAAGATGYRVELLSGETLVTSVDTDAATTTTTLTGLQSETAYTVRLSVIGTGGTGPAVTVDVTTLRPPVPAQAPAAPSASALGPDPAPGFTAAPATVIAGGTVTVTGLPARTWVYGWLFSAPIALGWAWTGADGDVTLTVPDTVPAGAHRLALSAADGTLLGWVGLQVTAPAAVPAASALARTGLEADLAPVTALGAFALLAGAALVARSTLRSRRASR